MLNKWQELLSKCKTTNRANSIFLWHEKTNAIMQANLYELKKKLMSAKTTNF